MSDATSVPQLQLFLWGTPSAPNPTLTSPLEDLSTAQTATFSSAPLDSAGVALTGDFLFAVRNKAGFTEVCYVPAAGFSGTTATGVIRGINTGGGSIDYTATGGDDYRAEHEQGSAVFCPASSTHHNIIIDWIQGTSSMASGGTTLTVGDETDTDVTIQAALTSTVGFLRKDAGTGKAQYSNDGAAWVNIDSVTASNLVDVSATDTTPGYLQDKLIGDGTTTSTTLIGGGGDEDLQISANGTLANMVSDVTATAAEINQLDGISANVTDTNLNTLTAGSSSNADALHTHSDLGVFSGTAGEAIDGSATPVAVVVGRSTGTHAITIWEEAAQRRMNVASLADLNMGEQDSNQMVAQSFTYEDTAADTVTLNKIRVAVQKNNGPGDNFQVFLYDDSSDTPGSLVTNGTGTTVTGASLSSNAYQWTEFTWAVDPELTPGDKYWIVFDRSGANDGTHYFELGNTANAAYSNHGYSVFDDVGGTWGAEQTNDICMQIIVDVDYSGDVLEADANQYARFNTIGFTADNVAGGASIDVQPAGVVSGFTGLNVGEKYYLSTTSGEITSSPSGAEEVGIVPVGTAVSTTELLLQPGQKMIRWETSTMDLWEVTAAYTADFFFELGFKPTRIQWMLDFTDNAATFNMGLTDSFFAVDDVRGYTITPLGASHVTQTGTTQIRIEDMTTGTPKVTVTEVFNTGVTIRITGNTNDFLGQMRFIAFGN
jgi:hypothetical protein